MYNVIAESVYQRLHRVLDDRGIEHDIIQFADDTTVFYNGKKFRGLIER